MNTLIPPGANFQMTYAVAINERGEIAGFGVPPGCAPENYETCGHAYVLFPCERNERCVNTTAIDVTGHSAATAESNTGPAVSQRRAASTLQQALGAMRNRIKMMRRRTASD